MPRRYTAQHAAKAVRLFLVDDGLDEDPVEMWPLAPWVQEAPNRFVVRNEGESEIVCTVQESLGVEGHSSLDSAPR
jgi:hypothetical protein